MNLSIQITETNNGFLVQIPTLFGSPSALPFDIESLGEMVQTAQGNGPDPLIANLQREQNRMNKAQSFDRASMMAPGTYHFPSINKALEFIRYIIEQNLSPEEAITAIYGK